jgi:hypothetical protein
MGESHQSRQISGRLSLRGTIRWIGVEVRVVLILAEAVKTSDTITSRLPLDRSSLQILIRV